MNTVLTRLFFVVIVITSTPAFAQDSTSVDESDTIVVRKNGKEIPIETYAAKYNPRKAMLLSAALPGLGQAYNKKYWKIPLVIGGFAGLGYGVWWNQDRYLFYRRGLFRVLNEPANPTVDPTTGLTALGNQVIGTTIYFPVGQNGALSKDVLRNAVNKFRRDRDYMTIMCFIFYMLQMVDAHVDAHLKEFDLNPQLKVSIDPGVNNGVGLTLKF
ncbi:MAG: DUF5683 domain-containing protein [Bacteroidota bacterium]